MIHPWKRTAAALALSAALLTAPAAASSLQVNGGEMPAYAAMLEENTTYVGLRAVTERLLPQASVTWENRTAVVHAPGLELTARPGDQWLEVNGRCLYIKNKVKLVDGSVMVPVRVLAEAYGGVVEWDQATRTALLTCAAVTPTQANYDQEDLYWLSRIISAESRGEIMRGKLAVGTVVMNRVAHREFPDSIYGVIFDLRWGGQFEPVSNGTIYNTPTAESVTAAKLVLEGVREAEGSLYFLNPALAQNFWTPQNRPFLVTIGNHDFYG